MDYLVNLLTKLLMLYSALRARYPLNLLTPPLRGAHPGKEPLVVRNGAYVRSLAVLRTWDQYLFLEVFEKHLKLCQTETSPIDDHLIRYVVIFSSMLHTFVFTGNFAGNEQDVDHKELAESEDKAVASEWRGNIVADKSYIFPEDTVHNCINIICSTNFAVPFN